MRQGDCGCGTRFFKVVETRVGNVWRLLWWECAMVGVVWLTVWGDVLTNPNLSQGASHFLKALLIHVESRPWDIDQIDKKVSKRVPSTNKP